MQMYEYWNNGISCREFRKERISDIDMMLSIKEAMNQKSTSVNNQQVMLANLLKDKTW